MRLCTLAVTNEGREQKWLRCGGKYCVKSFHVVVSLLLKRLEFEEKGLKRNRKIKLKNEKKKNWKNVAQNR